MNTLALAVPVLLLLSSLACGASGAFPKPGRQRVVLACIFSITRGQCVPCPTACERLDGLELYRRKSWLFAACIALTHCTPDCVAQAKVRARSV